MTAARDDNVVQLHKATDLVPVRRLPSRHAVKVNVLWWGTRLANQIPWLPVLAAKELVPVFRGIGRAGAGWSRWVSCTEYAEAAKAAEGNARAKAGEDLEDRRTGRKRITLGVAAVLLGGGTYLWFTMPHLLIGIGVVALVVFDLVGRRGVEKEPFLPPVALPSVLSGNVPLSQITESILATFEREGFEPGTVQVAAPLIWDEGRMEYRIRVKTADQIRPEHVDAIERAVGAKDGAIRNLATGTASIRELVIRVGDPLAHTELPPWTPTGSRSIKQPLDLGESSGDKPFSVKFAGLHTAVVGKTGSGKTEGLLYTVIDRLSACRDVVLWGCDLQIGPAFPMWRSVIQRTAYTEDETEAMLTAAQAEIDRRMRILQELAEDDDPANDKSSWDSDLGPALVIIIDEFAVFAANNGKNGKPDYMGPLERIIRTGRKVWVLLILATQKAGNSDFGSTVISSQIGIKILMACENDDTVTVLSKAMRDAGWLPHLLTPAEDEDPQDAGKCYVASPTHRTPDIYRTYMAMEPGEVKRRARQRLADGLPTLNGRRSDVVDAVEVPEVLAEVERVFAEAGNPPRMATAELLERLGDGDERWLADALRPTGLRPRDKDRWRPAPGANPVRGYYLEDVQAAVRRLS